MYDSNFVVLLHHYLPGTQIWTQTFIVAYENSIFKSIKLNSCFRNWCYGALKSAQALLKDASNQPIRVQYFWPDLEFINFQSEFGKLDWFKLFWLVCLHYDTSRYVLQMNWIQTQKKPVCLHGA